MMNWNDLVGSGRALILRYYPGIPIEELRDIMKILRQNSRFPGRDLNPRPTEYEAGMLTTLLNVRSKKTTKNIFTVARTSNIGWLTKCLPPYKATN
jgi:hypothetical protein